MTITTVDADQHFTALLGEIPRTLTYVDNRIRADRLDAGITKRLLAALTSAGERGGVLWDARPTNFQRQELHHIDGITVTQQMRVTAQSGGGVWSDRAWWMQADYVVAGDPWGVVTWELRSGRAFVTGSEMRDVTQFNGLSVAALLLDVYRSKGMFNTAMLDRLGLVVCDAPMFEHEVDAWLSELVETAEDLRRRDAETGNGAQFRAMLSTPESVPEPDGEPLEDWQRELLARFAAARAIAEHLTK